MLRFLIRSGSGYAWSCLKNCVKIIVGRRTYFNDRDLFLRQQVLYWIDPRRTPQITCIGFSGEGAGSQALMTMHAIAFARASGLSYVHTPFAAIAHPEKDMAHWAADWEALFNLGAGEAPCEGGRHEVVNYGYNFSDIELGFGWGGRRDELAICFKNAVPEFRRKYYLNKSTRTTRELRVAVHVRRGDVAADRNDHLYTSTRTIRRTVALVKAMLDTHNIAHALGIYSQGKIADFAELSVFGAELFTDVDAVWTMQELIKADVLIMAKGSFSYCAGLISGGIKIFEPYGLPLDDWILRDPDGSFDCAAFERQLFLFMERRNTNAASIEPVSGESRNV